MRRVPVVLLIVLFGATSAMAASLYVPFFNDSGDDLDPSSPNTGTATFISLKNISAKNFTGANAMTVAYFEEDGTADPLTANTFTLLAGQTKSFRPVADDSAEGSGQTVPNKPSDPKWGSCVITLPGTGVDGDVIGRVIVINRSFYGQSSYQLEHY